MFCVWGGGTSTINPQNMKSPLRITLLTADVCVRACLCVHVLRPASLLLLLLLPLCCCLCVCVCVRVRVCVRV